MGLIEAQLFLRAFETIAGKELAYLHGFVHAKSLRRHVFYWNLLLCLNGSPRRRLLLPLAVLFFQSEPALLNETVQVGRQLLFLGIIEKSPSSFGGLAALLELDDDVPRQSLIVVPRGEFGIALLHSLHL